MIRDILVRALFALGLASLAIAPALPAVDPAARGLSVAAKLADAANALQSARPSQGLQPVCNGAGISTSGQSAGGTATQFGGRTLLYCPKGVKSLTLVYGGAYSSTNSETDLASALSLNLSYAVAPAPWDVTKSYAIGDRVSWYPTSAQSSDPIFVATAASTGSMPKPGNANWSAGSETPIRITCGGGKPACGLGTVSDASGTVTAQGMFQTDPITPGAACAGPCYIAVRFWTSTAATMPYSAGQSYAAGASWSFSTSSVPDYTAAGTFYSPISATGQSLRPLLAIGVPAIDDGRSVCIIGDSIATGTTGYGMGSAFALTSGGSGYTAADIGRVVTSPDSGGTSGASGTPAQWLINQVAGGAVTSLRLISDGSYTNTASNTNQTLPTGAQILLGTTDGTGLSITPSAFNNGGFDQGDQYLAQGFLQRGLAAAGIRYVQFVSPGDGILNWSARDYSRLAFIAKSGCTSAIIELAINDITNTNNYTAAQIEAADVQLAYDLLGRGVKAVYLTTILPFANSTNGYVDLAGQSVPARDSVRQSHNTWIRKVPAPFSGIIDVAATLEHGGASAPDGKYIVNGTIGPIDIDAKHLTIAGHILAAQAITGAVPMLK